MEIIRKLNETTQEVWGFTWLDRTLVFNYYELLERPKGKRRWSRLKHWARLYSRDSNINEPELPNDIAVEALSKAMEEISVKTWSEYKSR